ncbi:MAG: hypothetical protein H0W50_00695 [Parachlamydiaceae bacterium]|nr:hypothetical protein [Parachlamydiaceae bacterium]
MLVTEVEAITLLIANIIITKTIIVGIVIKQMNKILSKYCVIMTSFSLLMGLGVILQAEISVETISPESNQQKGSVSGYSAEDINAPGTVYFAPPPGWQYAQSEMLNPNIRVMVVGTGKSSIPPSMNLTVEPYKGTLKQYLKLIKDINSSKGNAWTDLGKIKTAAGDGSLSQLDKKTLGEDMRMLHTVILKNGKIYILTAAAAKSEFSSFYKQFFAAMSSLHINDE